MNILFVCKHNLFRSKVAEAYFKKINKNKSIIATSAGIIKGDFLNKNQKKSLDLQKIISKKFGLEIRYKFTGLSMSLLKKQDVIIIAAGDVPKILFDNKAYVKNVVQWKIKDYNLYGEKRVIDAISQIIAKVDNLAKGLK